MIPWLEEHREELTQANPETLEGVRIAEGLEKIRERRRKNDVADSKLVQRSWVVERMARAAGELNAIRSRSESEHAVRLAAAGDDVPQNRAVLRGVWDDIMRAIQGLGAHFEEVS